MQIGNSLSCRSRRTQTLSSRLFDNPIPTTDNSSSTSVSHNLSSLDNNDKKIILNSIQSCALKKFVDCIQEYGLQNDSIEAILNNIGLKPKEIHPLITSFLQQLLLSNSDEENGDKLSSALFVDENTPKQQEELIHFALKLHGEFEHFYEALKAKKETKKFSPEEEAQFQQFRDKINDIKKKIIKEKMSHFLNTANKDNAKIKKCQYIIDHLLVKENSGADLAKIFSSFFTQTSTFPIIYQILHEALSTDENSDKQKNELEVNKIYTFLKILEEQCLSNIGKAFVSSPQRQILLDCKTLILRFYDEVKDANGCDVLKKKNKDDLAEQIKIQILWMESLNSKFKGLSSSTVQYDGLFALCYAFFYNAATDFGSATSDFVNWVYHGNNTQIQDSIGVAYNSAFLTTATLINGLWHLRSSQHLSKEISEQMRHSGRVLKNLMDAYHAAETKGDTKFSPDVLKRANQLYRKSLSWWLWGVSYIFTGTLVAKVSSQNQTDAIFFSQIDGAKKFQDLIVSKKYDSFQEIENNLNTIKDFYKKNNEEEGEEEFNKAVFGQNALIFNENKKRGSLFSLLMIKYKNNPEILNAIVDYWKAKSPSDKKEVTFCEIIDHKIPNFIERVNKAEREKVPLYFEDFVQEIFFSNLSLNEKKEIFDLVLNALRLKDNGLLENLRARRSDLMVQTLVPALTLEGFNLKRMVAEAYNVDSLSHLSAASAATTMAMGWSITSVAPVIYDLNKTTDTVCYKSAEAFLESCVQLCVQFSTPPVLAQTPEENSSHEILLKKIEAFKQCVSNATELSYELIQKEYIDFFKEKGVLKSTLESLLNNGEPLILTLVNKLSQEDAKKLLQEYFTKETLNESVAPALKTILKGIDDADDPYNLTSTVSDFEKFQLFFHQEQAKAKGSKYRLSLLSAKLCAYCISLDLTNETEKKLHEQCTNLLNSVVRNAHKHVDSSFRALTKRNKRPAAGLKATARIAVAFQWGFLTGLAFFTNILAPIGMVKGALVTLVPGVSLVGLGIILLSAALRMLGYKLTDKLTHTENAKSFVSVLNMLDKCAPQSKDKKFIRKKETLVAVTKAYEEYNVNQFNKTPFQHDFKFGIQKKKLLLDNYSQKIDKINKFQGDDLKQMDVFEKIVQLFLTQVGTSKEVCLVSIVNIIEILMKSNIDSKIKCYRLAQLGMEIMQENGPYAVLRLESDFMTSINFGIPTFLGGLGTAYGAIGSLTVGTIKAATTIISPPLSVVLNIFLGCLPAIVGDVQSAYANAKLGSSPTGNTKSYQAVIGYVRESILCLSMEYAQEIKNENPEEYKQIQSIFASVMTKNIRRNPLYRKDTEVQAKVQKRFQTVNEGLELSI